MNKLSPEAIIGIQEDIVNEYPDKTEAGSVNSLGFVSFAQVGETFGHERTIHQAATDLLVFIVITHPFPDGNKRTALNTVETFYALNGYEFDYGVNIVSLLKQLADRGVEDIDVERIPDYFESTTKHDPEMTDVLQEVDIDQDFILEIAKEHRDENRRIYDQLAST